MKLTQRFSGVRGLLRRRDFRRLCVSQLYGGLGEWLATLALIGLVWDRTHSAFISGAVLAFRILPAAILNSFLATFVDRFDRRRVLVTCTAGRALIYGVLPLIGGVAPVLALALIAEVATLAYVAARDATLPRLVPADQLTTANAISLVSMFAAMPIGSGVYAALLWMQSQVMGAGQAFSLVAASAMLFAATYQIGRIAAAAGVGRERAAKGEATYVRGALREIVRGDAILRRVMIGGAIVACCAGSLLTLGLAYVRETLHAGSAAYSGLLTSFCFGAILGVAAVQKSRKHLARLFHVGSIAMGGILVAMAIFPSTTVAFAMAAIFGAAAVATMLGGVTILQERICDSARGRAFAIAHSVLRVGAVTVGLVAAWVAHRLGAGHVIWTMDGTQIMLCVAGLAMFGAGVILVKPARVATVAA